MTDKKFSRQIRGDQDAIHMSVPEVAGLYVSRRLVGYKSCVELCSAIGMMSICVAQTVPKVIGIDIDERRVGDARKNAAEYNIEDRVSFVVGDVLDENLLQTIKADVAILDPDWSAGTDKTEHVFDIETMQPNMRTMIQLTKKNITDNLVIRVPKHFDLMTLSDFGEYELESVYIDGKLKFKVVYFLLEAQRAMETEVYLDS